MHIGCCGRFQLAEEDLLFRDDRVPTSPGLLKYMPESRRPGHCKSVLWALT